jgi:acetyl-CoA acyltransferase 2
LIATSIKNIVIMSTIATQRAVYIVAAKRTPFGTFGGSLKDVSAVQLGVIATKAAWNSIVGKKDDSPMEDTVTACYYGNVIASGPDAAYLARHIALKSGMGTNTSTALTLNRLCGSGFETVIQGYHTIQRNEAQVVLAGGTEQMSQAPLTVPGHKVRWGTPLGTGLALTDALWDGLTDIHAGCPMGITAENLAQKYNISRTECDEFALRSQRLWGKAKEAGVFNAEMAPVTITSKKGDTIMDTDEHPRPDTDMGKVSKLKSVFTKDGVVTAANASGICDGAGSIILASEEAVQQYGWTPLCRIASTAVTGCDPTIMGIGPVQAIRNALTTADITLSQVDHVEINEAFAAQFLACAKELNLDYENKANLHGGAIALGHPLGASGSRITAHLAHQFTTQTNHQYHLGAACIGGGQGIAVLLERC